MVENTVKRSIFLNALIISFCRRGDGRCVKLKENAKCGVFLNFSPPIRLAYIADRGPCDTKMDGILLDKEVALAAAHNLAAVTPAENFIKFGQDCMVA